jgi:uncharacterized protein (TIGR03663 family)
LCVLVVSRYASLAERPLHHDEAVNVWKIERLLETGRFEYDPNNYHGPALYFPQLLPTALWWMAQPERPFSAGITESSLRSLVALAGCLVLVGLWRARSRIGEIGALVALICAGASCSLLYYSRDFIHEIYLVLFSLVLYLSLARFGRTGRPRDLNWAAAAAALAFCTKETSVLTFAALGAAYLGATFLTNLGNGVGGAWFDTLRELHDRIRIVRPALWNATLLAAAIWFALFSSFLLHLRGLVDSFVAFAPWMAEAARSAGHSKEFTYYAKRVLWEFDPALSVLAVLGVLVAVWKWQREGLFLALWAAAMFIGYSIIPYKTPWLILNGLLPMSLLAGWGVAQLVTVWDSRWRQALGIVTVLLCVGVLGVQARKTLLVNYEEYDDSLHAIVYAQTHRDIRRMLLILEAHAADLPKPVAIEIVSKDYWPLPFYLRPYEARFWGTSRDVELNAPIVIAEAGQREELAQRLGEGWSATKYGLRPGVVLELWVRDRRLSGSTSEE